MYKPLGSESGMGEMAGRADCDEKKEKRDVFGGWRSSIEGGLTGGCVYFESITCRSSRNWMIPLWCSSSRSRPLCTLASYSASGVFSTLLLISCSRSIRAACTSCAWPLYPPTLVAKLAGMSPLVVLGAGAQFHPGLCWRIRRKHSVHIGRLPRGPAGRRMPGTRTRRDVVLRRSPRRVSDDVMVGFA